MRSPVGGEIGEAPPVADEASRFRGSAPIGGHDSARQSVGTTVGKRAPPLRKRNKNCGEAGRRGRRPLQSSIGEWCVGTDVGIGSPHRTSRYANASGGALSVTSDRKYPKNAAKTNGFGILARAWCGMYRGLSSPRIKQYKSVPCFRIASGSIHRDALRACAARPNRTALCVYRAARCGHRALRSSIGKRSVGDDAYIVPPSPAIKLSVGADASVRPPTTHRTPCNVSLRDQFANWSWQSVLQGPLPKGGWHGEAVTGGFRWAAHFWGRGIPLILFILSHFPKKARLPL